MNTLVDSTRRAANKLLELSMPLIAGVVTALIWVNVDPAGHTALIHYSPFGSGSHYNVHFMVNDIFMALFFGIAAKEITESCLPGGALNPPRKAINPLFATAGGVLGPIAFYLGWVAMQGGGDALSSGWGIPTATDIAIAWLVARLALGKSHPGVNFLLLLAVADDGIGLGIIAIFYPDPAHPVAPAMLLLVAAAMGLAYGLRRMGAKSWVPYLLGPGVISWVGLYAAHLHPALALVVVVPFMPHGGHDQGLFAEGEERRHTDTLNAFEHAFKTPVDLGLFVFGLANAGVALTGTGAATTAVLLALLVGKTVGITGFAMLGHALGFSLPDGMNVRSVIVVGLCASVGLTVALFVSGVAFTDPTLRDAAKMGALLSVVAAPIAIAVSRLLGVHQSSLSEDEGRPEELYTHPAGQGATVSLVPPAM